MDQLTSQQIAEWEAFNTIDPIGKWRDDFNIAKLESLLVNIVQQLYAKKGAIPVVTSPIDFMMDWADEREPKDSGKQSVETMKQILTSFATSHNKNIKKQKKIDSRPPVKKTNRKIE